MAQPKLTAEALRRLYVYDPHTGLWMGRTSERKQEWFPGAKYHRYLALRIFDYKFFAHRLAWLYMTGEWPKREIDHIDLDKANNRWSNLRAATSAQNRRNVPRRSHNTSGFKGVSSDRGRWRATIKAGGKQIYLGSFATPEEAHQAYRAASEQLHGGFGRLQ